MFPFEPRPSRLSSCRGHRASQKTHGSRAVSPPSFCPRPWFLPFLFLTVFHSTFLSSCFLGKGMCIKRNKEYFPVSRSLSGCLLGDATPSFGRSFPPPHCRTCKKLSKSNRLPQVREDDDDLTTIRTITHDINAARCALPLSSLFPDNASSSEPRKNVCK